MKKCIVIPDSFKGTLSAAEVSEIMRIEIQKRFPECEIITIPIADGGEGTLDCFCRALPASRIPVETTGPYGERQTAYYARVGDTGIVEMAMCAGLPQVEGREDPSRTTTYGVGTVMRKAIADGCTELVLGLGGSCTNDCGAGMAAALGVRFMDRAGKAFVPTGGNLSEVADIDPKEAHELLRNVRVTAMCDVDNPLYGENGAAFVFAPQKGADAEMVRLLDENLRAFAGTVKDCLGIDISSPAGGGAAGGMGAGVIAFTHGVLERGIDTVLNLVSFDALLEGAELVLTGEGRLDSQSLNGKVVSGIARHTKEHGVPLVAVVGSVGEGAQNAYEIGVNAIFSINRRAEAFETARFHSAENLAATMEDLMRFYAVRTM